ncbi:MAG: hypothetical protein U0L47_03025 [Paludibacteraceae bacterium]|nr:hypothetical protein [Paludibacteraceae bacterium]
MRILWIIFSVIIFVGLLGMLYTRIQEYLSYHRKSEAEKSLLRSKIYYRKERKVVRKTKTENTIQKVKTLDKKKDDTTVILTREHIKSARTANGGLTKHQLEAIGIEWPLKKGSINSKIGTEITQEQLEQFLTVKYVKKGKKK